MLTSSKHKTYEENNPKTHCSQVIQNQLFKKKNLKGNQNFKKTHYIHKKKEMDDDRYVLRNNFSSASKKRVESHL